MEIIQTKPNIYQRISAIMGELDYIQKGSAKVNGQYSFVSHDAVTAKLHPLFVKHGIVVIPTVESCVQEGNRTSIKLLVAFINIDVPQDSFQTAHYGYGIDPSDKGIGKAISYAFKYALLKTFCLETGDDPDNAVNTSYEPEKCLEFDLLIMSEIPQKKHKKVDEFLAYSAGIMKKHVEDVKREACKKTHEFHKAFTTWALKEKE